MMNPSSPTSSRARASNAPISASPSAEKVPTASSCRRERRGRARLSSPAIAADAARSMPRHTPRGAKPAATAFTPSRAMVPARTTAVVAPSPALSAVRYAASRRIPRAHVGDAILELDRAGNRAAVARDLRRIAGHLDDHATPVGTEGRRNGLGREVETPENSRPRLAAVYDLLGAGIAVSQGSGHRAVIPGAVRIASRSIGYSLH